AKETVEELEKAVKQLETDFDEKVEQSSLVRELRDRLKAFEDEVSEKKQMLKVQSQRLADMKKTIQRELKINPDVSDTFAESCLQGSTNQLSPRMDSERQKASQAALLLRMQQRSNETHNGDADAEFDPVNLEYLKHVVIKFITSREYEAVQLTRAVSTLLHMSPEEEILLRETLEWKMSWFGSRPNIGKGQMAKAIPPSQ
ncbi:UNVERIFIED_CONTAM: hypothetical protein GTU68_016821, partial [Idotea baltica]|nr:hypothetical protein [Idotea baltica]